MSTEKQIKVNISTGELLGSIENSLYVFRGIPYASPPVGNLRWMPPQPPLKCNGVRHALKTGNIAPQNSSHFKKTDQFVIVEPQSEDCLHLNIWSPGLDGKNRPVLVWVHGGAFTLGSGSQADFNGSSLASRGNVVVVTINYRLGLLGFLNLNEVTWGKIPSTGNEGLLDQIAALRWIKENISVFGGNPANVTLMGESAGAMGIACLMAMPEAKNLFHKVISQSGNANKAKPLDQAVQDAKLFIEKLGMGEVEAQTLRSLTVNQLLFVQQDMETAIQAMTIATPVIDGNHLPASPIEAIRSGSAARIPVLLGTNLDEWRLFNPNTPNFQKMDYAGLVKRCSKIVPSSFLDTLIEAYCRAREKRKMPITPSELFMAIKSDHDFRIPTIRLAEAQSHYNPEVYSYLFDWKSPDETFGSCHSLEIGFVFGTYNNNKSFYGSGPSAEKLSLTIQDAWSAFAWTGNPSCRSLGIWPVYDQNRTTYILGPNIHLEDSPLDEERRAWDSIPETYSRL